MKLVVGDRVGYVIHKQESSPAAHSAGMAFVIEAAAKYLTMVMTRDRVTCKCNSYH